MLRVGEIRAEASCVFCRILADVEPAGIVVKTEALAIFTTHQPYNPGHALVVPRRHIATIYELPDELAAAVFQATARVARAAKTAFAADGITIRQHNEAAGGQEVSHLHVHVIPRHRGDEALLKRVPPLIDLRAQRQAAALLRAAWERQGATP